MDEEVSKIDLDSSVFRNQPFYNWLIINKKSLSVGISIIVYLETLFWYLAKRLSIEDFDGDIAVIGATIYPLDVPLAKITVKKAFSSILPFKNHARDFIIGSTAIERKAILLTYNIKHFTWMPLGMVKTPENYME